MSMLSQQSTDPPPARFVAYVYPGWHQSEYRPGVDEWRLLDTFMPRFEGHVRPTLPIVGDYDDSSLETARRQRDAAKSAGIEGFTYFVYYQPNLGFVLAEPIRRMIELRSAETNGTFAIGTTWCIRLPHDRFPVAARDEMDLPDRSTVHDHVPLADRPIESLTLADIDELLGAGDDIWRQVAVESGFMANAARRRRRFSRSPDAVPRSEAP